jgi:hypothetical protein
MSHEVFHLQLFSFLAMIQFSYLLNFELLISIVILLFIL